MWNFIVWEKTYLSIDDQAAPLLLDFKFSFEPRTEFFMLLWQFNMCNQNNKGVGKGKKMEGVQMKYEMLLKKSKVQFLFILMLCWAIALCSEFVWSVQVACWEAAHLPPQDRLMTLSILNVFFLSDSS